MPLEVAVRRIDGQLRAVAACGLDLEERLEALLDQDVTIVNWGWMILGRQIDRGSGGRLDLLASEPPQDSKSRLAFRNRVLRGPAPF